MNIIHSSLKKRQLLSTLAKLTLIMIDDTLTLQLLTTEKIHEKIIHIDHYY